jgi:predicted nucleic acid-binding Zn ribbon protein
VSEDEQAQQQPGEQADKPAADRPRGPDLARAALDAARAAGRSPSARTRRPGRRGGDVPGEPDPEGLRRRRRGYSGAGPDPRDPQPFGRLIRRMVTVRGWQKETAEATVLAAWDRIAGQDVAGRCHPVGLRDGELTLQAESTAWATLLRLLVPAMLAKIADELGPGVVNRIRVHGPAAPSWRRGRRTVPGRGPRDTYG